MWTAAREVLICDIVNFYNLTPCVNLFHHPIKTRRIEFATHILIQRSLQQTQAGMIFFVTRRKWRRNFDGKFYDNFPIAFSFNLQLYYEFCSVNESQSNILPNTLFRKHQADMVLFSDTQVSPVLYRKHAFAFNWSSQRKFNFGSNVVDSRFYVGVVLSRHQDD